MKNIFKQIISDFHESKIRNTKKRQINIPLHTWKIISIVWPRRVWKSYLLLNIINTLLEDGVDKTDIIYINFEDERISIDWKNLQLILDAYLELYPDKKLDNTYFFFDEIQNIENWEKFVRRIYDNISLKIFITWSNSKLLSKEIATSLRWRSLTFELLSLSFSEFLYFKWKDNLNIFSTKGRAEILNLQREYLSWWWFPEIINFDKDLKIKTLQEYFEVMIYNDIIERYNIQDIALFKAFTKYLIQTTTKFYSINKIWNYLKNLWFKFDKNKIYNFVEYLENAYFWKTISKFAYTLKKQVLKKFYLFDNGFLNALSFNFFNDFGKLLENMVFIELYRKYQDNIYFLKNWSETDFIANENIYQVCYELNEQNKKREINWCFTAMNNLKKDVAYIITFEQEETLQINWKTIYVIPFYKWVLEK